MKNLMLLLGFDRQPDEYADRILFNRQTSVCRFRKLPDGRKIAETKSGISGFVELTAQTLIALWSQPNPFLRDALITNGIAEEISGEPHFIEQKPANPKRRKFFGK